MANTAAAPGSARRDYIDALKGFGIILVVAGHWGDYFRGVEPIYNALYECIYLFHMALFCICSGLVAKFSWRKWITQQIWIYLFSQALLLWFRAAVNHEEFTVPLWQAWILPWRQMWYLWALIFWELTVPLLHAARARGAVGKTLAMAVALGIGLAGGCQALPYEFMRVTGFFPCFAFGVLFADEVDAAYRATEKWVLLRLGAWAALAMLYGMRAWSIFQDRERERDTVLYYFTTPYGQNGYTVSDRLLCWAVGLLTTLALMWALGRSRMLASLGRRTLPVYVFHLIVQDFLLDRMRLFTYVENLGIDWRYSFVFVTFEIFAIVSLLSSQPVTAVFGTAANLWYKVLPGWVQRLRKGSEAKS